jgi:hypothetical protein
LIGQLRIFPYALFCAMSMNDPDPRNRNGSVFDAPPAHGVDVATLMPPQRRQHGSALSWAAFLLAFAALALTVWQSSFWSQEQAALVVTRTPDELAVHLDSSGETPELVADWQIIVANNSTQSITLTSSSVVEALPAASGVRERSLRHSYRSEDGSMLLDFPHIITAGHVAQFLLRVRLPLTPAARDLVAALLASDSSAALWDTANLLAVRGIDPFDTSDTSAGSISIAAAAVADAPAAPAVEHVFSVRLRTQRGTVLEDLVTWSEISGLTARH